MKTNQGTAERGARVVLGMAMAMVPVLFAGGMPALLAWGAGLVGVVLISTGLMGYCPAWHLMGVSTAKKSAGG